MTTVRARIAEPVSGSSLTSAAPGGAGAAFSPTRRERVTQCSLAALLIEVHRGMEDAFAELYRLTRDRIYAAVLRVVRSPELAGEVTQDAYLEIWQKSGRYEEDRGSALGWMITIARRRAVDRVRSVTRALALERRYTERSCALDHIDSWDEVTARLDAEQIRRTLDALSPIQREALTLRYLQQRPTAEVAELLQVPVVTVKSRIRDGLAKLRPLLAEDQPESAGPGRRADRRPVPGSRSCLPRGATSG